MQGASRFLRRVLDGGKRGVCDRLKNPLQAMRALLAWIWSKMLGFTQGFFVFPLGFCFSRRISLRPCPNGCSFL
ncbi:hypothetical protein LIPSTDRAFT_240790 [Lipomyces starkeyi NRRL Y-11557]|uniref:Uncharacterized protein n=1 Tax=Lipomyces starkeyi NRRL Y-11557 TaxID=675824 RepID=A0A1E3QC07_LIPST|nr:hypothetical protein LIPSTDRAFT_240790 [Lipomyces starkeyi NRRL Y-11557]